jgi:hypothetical protein
VWVLSLALVLSLVTNAWQAGRNSVLESQMMVQPVAPILTGMSDSKVQDADTASNEDDTAVAQEEKKPAGVWQVDTASRNTAVKYDVAPSSRTATQFTAIRLYLRDLDDALVETTDAPMSEEIAGEILDQVTAQEPVLLDLKIVALQVRIARVEAIVPPKDAAEHHRLTLLELGQGERLLEVLLRSRDGLDPEVLELADQQAARLVETSRRVQLLSKELKSGPGTPR